MAKQHYFFKLIPPRSTFPHDITPDEARLMEEHSRYFEAEFAAGRLLLYGPVIATGGAFGLAVLEVESEEEARRFGLGSLCESRIEPVRGSSHANLWRPLQANLRAARIAVLFRTLHWKPS